MQVYVSEAFRDYQVVMLLLSVAAFLAWVGFHAFRFGVVVMRSLRTWRGDAEQMPLFREDTGAWRRVLIAVLIAAALSATLQAYPVDCRAIPWWTIEWWWFCSGNN